MTATKKKTVEKNCCPAGVYWMRIEDNGGETTDVAVRASSEAAAWRFVCEYGTFQAGRYELLPTHPGPVGCTGGNIGLPNGMFQPRWGFDADSPMPAREQYLRYIHRNRQYGVQGRTIWVATEMP